MQSSMEIILVAHVARAFNMFYTLQMIYDGTKFI